jgi:hypothetical protein
MSDFDFHLFKNKSIINKFARKTAKIEATLLTQWLVPQWNVSDLTQTELLTSGLGLGSLGLGKDFLFESILGRWIKSNEKLKVKNRNFVKILSPIPQYILGSCYI